MIRLISAFLISIALVSVFGGIPDSEDKAYIFENVKNSILLFPNYAPQNLVINNTEYPQGLTIYLYAEYEPKCPKITFPYYIYEYVFKYNDTDGFIVTSTDFYRNTNKVYRNPMEANVIFLSDFKTCTIKYPFYEEDLGSCRLFYNTWEPVRPSQLFRPKYVFSNSGGPQCTNVWFSFPYPSVPRLPKYPKFKPPTDLDGYEQKVLPEGFNKSKEAFIIDVFKVEKKEYTFYKMAQRPIPTIGFSMSPKQCSVQIGIEFDQNCKLLVKFIENDIVTFVNDEEDPNFFGYRTDSQALTFTLSTAYFYTFATMGMRRLDGCQFPPEHAESVEYNMTVWLGESNGTVLCDDVKLEFGDVILKDESYAPPTTSTTEVYEIEEAPTELEIANAQLWEVTAVMSCFFICLTTVFVYLGIGC